MLALVVLVLCAEPSAKDLYDKGTEAFDFEDYQTALADFEQAYALDPRPSFQFNIGQCEKKLGHKELAVAAFRKYLDDAPRAPNRAAVEQMIAELSPRPASPPPPPTASSPAPASTADASSLPSSPPSTAAPGSDEAGALVVPLAIAAGAVVVVVAGVVVGLVATAPPPATLGRAVLKG